MLRNLHKMLFVSLMLVFVGVASGQVVEMPDPNLRQAVRDTLSLPDAVTLTQDEMLGLVRFEAKHAEIRDLIGLEYAKNLKTLDLAVNEISDISPLSTLTELGFLTLRNNPITNLSSLSNLTKLTYINLAGIKVSDISVLANLTELRSARLSHMGLRDITPLGKLVNLIYLNIASNQIEDISLLAHLTQLEELYISDNWILDCTPLEGLSLTQLERDDFCGDVAYGQVVEMPDPNLRQAIRATLGLPDEAALTREKMLGLVRFHAKEAGIEDLTGLEHAKYLKHLVLSVNNISNITALGTLTKLNFLILSDNPITDLRPLANLTNLTYINLTGIKVSDISALANLTELRQAVLSHMGLRDITPLGKLVNLTRLHLTSNQIEDISPLANLTQLEELYIYNNRVLDCTPLEGLSLTQLERDDFCGDVVSREIVEIPDPHLRQALRTTLGLSDEVALTEADMSRLVRFEAKEAEIGDLTGLEHAKYLKHLVLAVNEIRDITLLGTLTKLEFLILRTNPITDLTPLSNLTNLTYINLAGIEDADISPLANLTQLRSAVLGNMRLRDITPLGKLVNLIQLSITHNQIEDITPLANLTQLEELYINNNQILDFTPLEGLSLIEFERDEVCVLPGIPIEPRLANRSFPSIVQGWYDGILNRPELSREERTAFHDLWWRSTHFQDSEQGYQLTGSIERLIAERDAFLAKNPSMLFLAEIRLRDAHLHTQYPEDWQYWLRDEDGNLVQNWHESSGRKKHNRYLIDFRQPELQDIIVQQAIAVSKCGLYDGIMFDVWLENGLVLGNFHHPDGPIIYSTPKEEREALLTIVQRIRANVPDDFLILCNSNHRKLPLSAPYINGNFMETFRDYDGGYTHEWLAEIEGNLIWLEENLREPQINVVRGAGIPTEPLDGPNNRRWMRLFTTMSLTLSDGYALYVTGVRDEYQRHFWYPFWDTDLGQPIGPTAQRYQNVPSLYIREFTSGWAVYNRSGEAQTVGLPSFGIPVSDRGAKVVSLNHQLPDLDGEIYLKITVDQNGDGVVNVLDLILVANHFGTALGDVNKDGTTNVLDLTLVAQQFSQ